MAMRHGWLTGLMMAALLPAAGWSQDGAGLIVDDEKLTVADAQIPSEPGAGDAEQPLLEDLRRPAERLLQVSPEALLEANENAGRRLDSRMPSEPWLDAIARPPILTIYPSIQKGVAIKEWRLSIMDDAGNTLWTHQARGAMPAVLSWEGQIAKGGMIDVESAFFYTLGALDLGGNPIFMSGPSQTLSALAFPDRDRLVVRISSGRLFKSGKDIALSAEGEALLRESLNLVSQNRYSAFQITAFAAGEKLADLQAEQVVRYYMRQFTLPRTAFTLARQIVNDRFKVEIVCKP